MEYLMLLAIPLAGFFWGLGGQKGSAWRGLGCGISIGILAFIIRPSYTAFLIPLCIYIVTSVGYGIPSK